MQGKQCRYSIDTKYSMRTGKFEVRIDWVCNLVYIKYCAVFCCLRSSAEATGESIVTIKVQVSRFYFQKFTMYIKSIFKDNKGNFLLQDIDLVTLI